MRSIIIISCILFILMACHKPAFKSKWTRENAPDSFVARFETSKGNFDVSITKELSPKAADRFYQLVKHHVFNQVLIYRVVPKFVAQFGNSDTTVDQRWGKIKLPDEPVISGNKRGAISYARGGKETRNTQVFINLKDTPRLDTIRYNQVIGFPSFGRVIRGMNVVDSLYGGYEDSTMRKYSEMLKNRRAFLKEFPKLDSIRKAYIVKRSA